MHRSVVPVVALAGCAALVHAQAVEPGTTRLAFEVWNGSSWGSSAALMPGDRVEYRVTVSYTGTQNVFGLASGRYQPTFSNVDNDGPIRDANAPFRNGGISGNAVAGSVLSQAEGQSGGPLATYGRVGFAAFAMNTANLNVLTEHRHGGGFAQANAPAGSWMRLAGSGVTTWPLASIDASQATGMNLNSISRGVAITQASFVNPTGIPPNTFYTTGTQNLVVFRGALLLGDSVETRIITLSNAEGSLLRAGGVNSADDTRYFDWHTNQFGASLRSGVVVQNAIIGVIPSPSSASLVLTAGAVVATPRRRARHG